MDAETRAWSEKYENERRARLEAEALLSDRVRSLYLTKARLEEAQEELVRKERLATLGQLAGSVGHELRNPLGVMTNAVYYLEAVLPSAPPDVVEYLAILRKQIHLSERIVGDLLGFSRNNAPRLERVSIADLVAEQLSRADAPDGVRVERVIPDVLPDVMIDPVQIGQVLLNLIINALQAMEQGGTLTVRCAPDVDNLRVEVRDTGPGVPEQIRHKIFDPLFTTRARGIGLGLALSRSLAEANRGRLTLADSGGTGACFELELPLWREPDRKSGGA
jgi:signal transduction histidine kinase